jgi:hypothetical protein
MTTRHSRFIVYSPSSFVKKVLPVSTKLNVKQSNNLLYLCEVKQCEQNEPPTNTKGQDSYPWSSSLDLMVPSRILTAKPLWMAATSKGLRGSAHSMVFKKPPIATVIAKV